MTKINGTNIEIIRPFDGRKITTALFDFDGTLSRERDGWINLMIATNSAALVQAIPDLSVPEAVEWVINDIEQTIGIPTYWQMKRLAEEIKRRGGTSFSPQRYKDVYNQALVSLVKTKHQKMIHHEMEPEELRVPGSIELLTELKHRLGADALYLASGTDIASVKESMKLMGYQKFFGDRIIASGSTMNPDECPKQIVVETIIADRNLQSGQLLCFGDGVPELEYATTFGGVCVGLLTLDWSHYELQNHFTMDQKRARLINAGAHILVPDYRYVSKLVSILFSNNQK